MKRLFVIATIIVWGVSVTFSQTNSKKTNPQQVLKQDVDFGIKQYPKVIRLEGLEKSVEQTKTSNQGAFGVYHTDDSLAEVITHFKAQSPAEVPSYAGKFIRNLLRYSWKIEQATTNDILPWFEKKPESKTAIPDGMKVQTSFGVIVIKDSVLSVKLMSPYKLEDNNKLIEGTLIVIVSERLSK